MKNILLIVCLFIIGCSPICYSYIDPKARYYDDPIYAPPQRYYFHPFGYYDPFYYTPGVIYPRRIIVAPPRVNTPRQYSLPKRDYSPTPQTPRGSAPIREFKRDDK